MSSVLIRGGLVVDGTGRAAFPADVLVEGDRIADVIARPNSNPLPHVPEIDFDAIARAEDAKTRHSKHAASKSIYAD